MALGINRPDFGSGRGGRGRTRRNALSSPSNPWEKLQLGQLSMLGRWYKAVARGPLAFVPMIVSQLAFIPLLYSYLTFNYMESVGFNIPKMFAAVFSSLGALSPKMALSLKHFVTWLLELPLESSSEAIWKVILQTVLPLVPILYFIVVVPFVDILMGRDSGQKVSSRTQGKAGEEEETEEYRLVLWAFGSIYVALLLMSAGAAASLPILSVLTVTVGMGFYGSILFAVSHELMHSNRASDKAFSLFLLSFLSYLHYDKSHKLIHHVRVATPDDPATGRRGQNVYSFIYRSVVENWAILQTMPINKWTKASWVAAPSTIAAAFWLLFGLKGAAVYLGSSLVSVLMLEIVNYIEHYGLERKPLGNGRYEQVSRAHSWNADWFFTNCHIINLQLHGEHHLDSKCPYNKLENIKDGPQLPAPYPAMILLSLVPPLWFRVMDARLDQFSAEQGGGAGGDAEASAM